MGLDVPAPLDGPISTDATGAAARATEQAFCPLIRVGDT